MTRKPFLLLAAVCLASAGTARAQMAIDRLWVDIASGKVARSDLVIRNESKDRYYVTVRVTEVTNPGTPDEKRVSETDPEKLGLLVTPQRMIIDPGQLRAIRVVSLNQGLTRDRIYRINITPQLGNLEVEQADPANRGIAIKMLTAFDALVTVRPENAAGHLVATRDGGTLVLRNTGNSNILLLDGQVCPPKGQALSSSTQAWFAHQVAAAAAVEDNAEGDKATTPNSAAAKDAMAAAQAVKPAEPIAAKPDECSQLNGRRLYAGNTWIVPEAPGEVLKFDRRDSAGSDLRPITISCGGSNGGQFSSPYCNPAGVAGRANGAETSSHKLRDGETS